MDDGELQDQDFAHLFGLQPDSLPSLRTGDDAGLSHARSRPGLGVYVAASLVGALVCSALLLRQPSPRADSPTEAPSRAELFLPSQAVQSGQDATRLDEAAAPPRHRLVAAVQPTRSRPKARRAILLRRPRPADHALIARADRTERRARLGTAASTKPLDYASVTPEPKVVREPAIEQERLQAIDAIRLLRQR